MIAVAKKVAQRVLRAPYGPKDCFLSYHYQRLTQRRLEHLASLGLGIRGSTVLEVGAGIGDLTSFFLDRGCRVVSSEARASNLKVFRDRYPDLEIVELDLDHPDGSLSDRMFDIVHCYGVLYHLSRPAEAIEFMAGHCRKMMFVEACVSFGEAEEVNLVEEVASDFSQSVSGLACRPTRKWIYNQLKQHFQNVYMPITQPNHEEFPLDWVAAKTSAPFQRAVYIGSREKLSNPLLVESIPAQQSRC